MNTTIDWGINFKRPKPRLARGFWLVMVASLGMMMASTLTVAQTETAIPHPSQAGNTILITGSTDGLGREVALRLGALGAHVLVHGRNAERGNEVVEEISENGGTAQLYLADLASLDEVRALARRILDEQDRLDTLINNAGIGSGDGERRESRDGYELIFQVNYLSHFLLTDLLLPLIKDSAPSRIINVASGAQRPLNFDDIMLSDNYSGRAAYAQSKLAQILHTFYLADELKDDNITFNTLHPATMMDTTLVREMDAEARTTVDEGATALMNLAVSAELAEHTGLYFNGLQESRAHSQAYDRKARQRLMELSRELVDLDQE